MGTRISAVWELRDDTLEDCVCRVNETFHRLAQLAPEWSNWFRGYESTVDRERGPLYLLDKPDLIRRELVNGQHKHAGEIVADLGYFLTAASGPPMGKGTEMSFLRVNCCVRSPFARFNKVSLELPVKAHAPGLYDPDMLASAVAVLADVWDPDWALVWDGHTKIVPRPWEYGPVLGMVTYLPSRTGVVEGELPREWRWFNARGEKQIFIYQGGTPDPKNSNDVSSFAQMASRIRWSAGRNHPMRK